VPPAKARRAPLQRTPASAHRSVPVVAHHLAVARDPNHHDQQGKKKHRVDNLGEAALLFRVTPEAFDAAMVARVPSRRQQLRLVEDRIAVADSQIDAISSAASGVAIAAVTTRRSSSVAEQIRRSAKDRGVAAYAEPG
jgi:hypothetical protein